MGSILRRYAGILMRGSRFGSRHLMSGRQPANLKRDLPDILPTNEVLRYIANR